MLQIYEFSKPVVSIIMTAFNRANLIERAIKSVLRQTYKLWELIIVDDGSTDDTFSVINQYLAIYDNIRYMKHANRKLPLSKNAGLQAAVGEFAAFLDSDDEYLPKHLELRVNFLRENEGTDLIHGGIIIVGNPYVPDKNDLSRKIHLDQCTVGGTFFGKKHVFQKLEGFNNVEYSEDSEFLERAEKAFKIKKVDFPTYVYHRETPGSICSSKSPDHNSGEKHSTAEGSPAEKSIPAI